MDNLDELREDTRERRTEDVCVEELLRHSTIGSDKRLRGEIGSTARALAHSIRGSSFGVMQRLLNEYHFSSREGTALMCLAEAYLRTPDTPSLDALISDKLVGGSWGAQGVKQGESKQGESKHGSGGGSLLMSASHWSLLLSGRLLREFGDQRGVVVAMRKLLKRLGEPVLRVAIGRAMVLLGGQFVLATSADTAVQRSSALRGRGYRFSFDMLGEAARCERDALAYLRSYQSMIEALAKIATSDGSKSGSSDGNKSGSSAGNKSGSIDSTFARPLAAHNNCGVSVKLSGLYARYEYAQKDRVMAELVPRFLLLVRAARDANIPLTVDAEEAARSDLLLSVFAASLSALDKEDREAGRDNVGERWNGIGIVLQAYRTNTLRSLDYVYALARRFNRHIAIRLVKGAYWDSEIKHAQTLGLDNYPVYTRKSSTDLSYLVCVRRLLSMRDFIFPQFGTHNAHSAASILCYARASDQGLSQGLGQGSNFELQRIHGMGDMLHDQLRERYLGAGDSSDFSSDSSGTVLSGVGTRIYAPVGEHEDLLAYLVRRMLENGANSSFVYQALDTRISLGDLTKEPEQLVRANATRSANRSAKSVTKSTAKSSVKKSQTKDKIRDRISIRAKDRSSLYGHPQIPLPPDIFKDRQNSQGWDINDASSFADLQSRLTPWLSKQHEASSGSGSGSTNGSSGKIKPTTSYCTANGEVIGKFFKASDAEIEGTCAEAWRAQRSWSEMSVDERATILERVADLYEEHSGELMALLAREAGKTLLDSIGEVREAVDFCRYYAQQGRELFSRAGDGYSIDRGPLGLIVCISPWNFPLAIFTGQIAAALVCGNSVVAKPAEQTPLIAHLAVQLFYRAGLPRGVLGFLLGEGEDVGVKTLTCAKASGVCFTGSGDTARSIDRLLSRLSGGKSVLIAETGGINAMIMDSTALMEQVVRDVLVSAFQSTGQRCSALRVLFVQSDVRARFIPMLVGASEELRLGLPWLASSDLGPVIDSASRERLVSWSRMLSGQGSLEAGGARCLFKGKLPSCELASNELASSELAPSSRGGFWFAPHIFELADMGYLTREVFGPVLHIVSYGRDEVGGLVERINGMGYGLTFGVHSRLEGRIASFVSASRCGNIYVNRNQIGAIVGCQPFGGEGLSGTGPKAGSRGILLRLSCAEGGRFRVASGSSGLRKKVTSNIANNIANNFTGNFASGLSLVNWRSLLIPKVGLFDGVGLDSLQSSRSQDWTYAPSRLRVLLRAVRRWRGDFRKLGELILSQARLCYMGDGTLEGTTGERNQLYTTSRGVIACFGGGIDLRTTEIVDNGYGLTGEQILALQVLGSFAFGNRVILAGAMASEKLDISELDISSLGRLCGELCSLAPRGYVSLLRREGESSASKKVGAPPIDDFTLEALRSCDALLFDGGAAERATYSVALSDFSDRRRLLLSLEDDVCFLGVHRVVSEDTTASGGNASLLLTASKD